MISSDLHFLSIGDLSKMLRDKDISPVELTRAYLDRIDTLDQRLGAFITIMGEEAIAQATQAEEAIVNGRYMGRLHGIPVAIKDIIFTRGVLTSAGSKVLRQHIPSENSTLVERLNASGAILLGKLNLSEFAIGGTINHPYGTPRNPWNLGHSAGGSSSGSGIAVAGGLCAGALGSDTGGSIRGPAAFCGIVGIRPTYGRVTRHGVIPMAWSMDTIGPMTRFVADCAIMLEAVAGRDERDPTSSHMLVPNYLESLDTGFTGLRIAFPKEMFDYEGLDVEIRDAVMSAIGVLQNLGAVVDEISLPMSPHSGAVFLALADTEAAAFHINWLKDQGDHYDWSTRTRLESAALTPSAVYLKADRARELIRRELMNALKHYDVIIAPTGSSVAPTLSASTGRPGGYYQGHSDIGRRRYTSPAALAGLPALSIPCGFSSSGLPIGLQMIGRPFQENILFMVGQTYEQATSWHTMNPAVA